MFWKSENFLWFSRFFKKIVFTVTPLNQPLELKRPTPVWKIWNEFEEWWRIIGDTHHFFLEITLNRVRCIYNIIFIFEQKLFYHFLLKMPNFCSWGNQSHVGGLCMKTPVLNNFSLIYYWEPIFGVEYRQTMYFLEKYMKYPFYTFYPFFGGSKCPR